MKLGPAQLNQKQVAARHGVSLRELRRWREQGCGPKYRRLNKNVCLYDIPDLDDFFFNDLPKYQSTSEEPN